MNLTIIGASAGVGLATVKRALERNHTVTTLSRSEIDLPPNPYLIKLKGSATNRTDLKKSLEKADAVIVALGTGKSMKPTALYSDFARVLVEVQREIEKDVPFIVLTGFGAGNSWGFQSNWLMELFFKFLLKDAYADKTNMEETITKSFLKWVIRHSPPLKCVNNIFEQSCPLSQ